ncbi:MAG: flagellar assembly protein FliH [Armatimonadetes bacterium]|nr:flagellar assembly protein FliH [Armatimonadota bacterium]
MTRDGLPPQGGLLKPEDVPAAAQWPQPQPQPEPVSAPTSPSGANIAVLARRVAEALDAAMDQLVAYATELALVGAQAIVGRTVAVDPRVVENSMRQALQQLAGHISVEFRVNPSDETVARELLSALRCGPRASVVADETVAPGGCLAVTELGEIDATLDSQMRRLGEIFGSGGAH